jgi:rhodanese-related sulfurtransferase
VSARDAWRRLESEAGATLVDVRTAAEWSYVGLPDLRELGGRALLIEWQGFPEMQLNADFADEVARAVPDPDTPVFFLCRSGARSAGAAAAMAERGYTRCYNIADGFEGDLDSSRRRGGVGGWKASGLPWVQS